MGYPKEVQNEYNKSYYSENKDAIAKRQSEKECCKYCGRSVRHDNIFKHTRSSYCMNRRKLNAKQIAADKKAYFKKVDDMISNLEHLCELNKIIEYATPPFVDFNKLATKKVRFPEVPDFSDEEEEYMNKYRDICRRLNCGDIEYDDLTEWEQDLCANRGVYLHMC